MAKNPFPFAPKKKLVEGSKAELAMDKKNGVVPGKGKGKGAKPNPFAAAKKGGSAAVPFPPKKGK